MAIEPQAQVVIPRTVRVSFVSATDVKALYKQLNNRTVIVGGHRFFSIQDSYDDGFSLSERQLNSGQITLGKTIFNATIFLAIFQKKTGTEDTYEARKGVTVLFNTSPLNNPPHSRGNHQPLCFDGLSGTRSAQNHLLQIGRNGFVSVPEDAFQNLFEPI